MRKTMTLIAVTHTSQGVSLETNKQNPSFATVKYYLAKREDGYQV
jgi:hypothetical protein